MAYSETKPNHLFHDSLGDPDTCTCDANHPRDLRVAWYRRTVPSRLAVRIVALAATLLVLLVVGISWLAGTAKADAGPGCQQVPWGFLGSQQRLICDGPIRPDGSWERTRVIGVPAHYRNARSSCYGGYYSSSCTYYEAGWVAQQTVSEDTYVVFPSNVLPDEPGHLS